MPRKMSGSAYEHDRRVDRRQQHADGGVGERYPLVAVGLPGTRLSVPGCSPGRRPPAVAGAGPSVAAAAPDPMSESDAVLGTPRLSPYHLLLRAARVIARVRWTAPLP